MLGAAARAFLAILLVGVMAGSAVAFAVGVNFSPHSQTCIPTGIPGYGPICITNKKYNLHHIRVKGFRKTPISNGRIHLAFKNGNSVPVQVKLVLTIKTKSGKIRRITKTFTLATGKTFDLNELLKGVHVRGAKLQLTVTDTTGDIATITKTIGSFDR